MDQVKFSIEVLAERFGNILLERFDANVIQEFLLREELDVDVTGVKMNAGALLVGVFGLHAVPVEARPDGGCVGEVKGPSASTCSYIENVADLTQVHCVRHGSLPAVVTLLQVVLFDQSAMCDGLTMMKSIRERRDSPLLLRRDCRNRIMRAV